jgi:DNA-binding transcriptional MerR regulator
MTLNLLSPGAVAKVLNLSTSRVIQLDREGVLPAMRDSAGRRLYDADAVAAFARARESARSSVSSDTERVSA